MLANLQAELADIILSNEQNTLLVKPTQHLRIYHNNIFSTLVRSLKETYPLIVNLIGENFFEVAAKAYITQYPSTNGDLHTYGEYFSDFLAEFAPVANLLYLSEVAKFEWACHIVFFSNDHAELDLQSLAANSPNDYDKLHFNLHPALQLLRFRYPILQIIDLCQHHIPGPVNIDSGGVNLLIIQRNFELSLISLTHDDYIFLDALQADLSLREAFEEAKIANPAFNLEEKLPHWVQQKIIVDIHLQHAAF